MSIFKAKVEKIDRKDYVVQLVRSPKRNKSISIKIDRGMVFMFVPVSLPMQEISQLLADKEQWIRDKLASLPSAELLKIKKYVEDESFLYLGQSYSLAIKYGKAVSVHLALGKLIVTIPTKKNQSQQIKEALYYWYRERAVEILTKKVTHFKEIVGVQPSEVRFKLFKSKWGSCDANGKVDFNWFIVLAPEWIIDYLVVHELTHLAYFSHSPKFWQEVEKLIPDHKKCEKWLATNGQALFI